MAPFSRQTISANRLAASPVDAADPLAARPIPRQLLLWLSAGTAGTLAFVIIYLIEGVTRPGYDPWRQTISALSFGPTGWVQQLNFALCGVSVLWSAYVWRRILAGGVCARWYPAIRAMEGLALVAIAIATRDPLHTAFLILIVNAMTLGLFVIARRFWGRTRWRGWAAFTIIMGLWPMAIMSLFGLALAPHSALGPYAGLFERLATNADTIWSLALLARLWSRRSIGI
ncbi:MAG TPA: DUF998 domain-containing protein [Ktedonobacterales bacterium]|nr:DUF998 domain-containing protein [Ktedonobacterales bacterium]